MKYRSVFFLILIGAFAIKCNKVQCQDKDSITFSDVETIFKPLDQKTKVRHTPMPVYTKDVEECKVSLNGTWWFNPAPEKGFENKSSVQGEKGWNQLPVPSEWYMHSYEVEKYSWGGYLRTWVTDNGISLLLANYSNGGSDSYLSHDAGRTNYAGELKMDGGDFAGWLQVYCGD